MTLKQKLQAVHTGAAAIKEPKEVTAIREVMARFLSHSRSFSSRTKARTAVVAVEGRRTLMLFENGRWTIASSVTHFSLGFSDREVRSRARRNGSVEVSDYLSLLEAVGLVTAEVAQAFRTWKAANFDAEQRRQDIAELKSQARTLGCHVVEGRR